MLFITIVSVDDTCAGKVSSGGANQRDQQPSMISLSAVGHQGRPVDNGRAPKRKARPFHQSLIPTI